MRRKMAANTTSQLLNAFDWFVRWRRSIGIFRNSDLRKEHFDEFLSQMADGDLLRLVPITERLDRMVTEVLDGTYTFPTAYDWKAPGDIRIEWDALGTKLGVPRKALGDSADFKAELIDRLPLLNPGNATHLADGVRKNVLTPKESFSARRIEGLLEPWVSVYRLGGNGLLKHDPLAWNPFQERSLKTIAEGIGNKRQRTSTISPSDFMRLLEVASVWVMDYSDYVLEAWDVMSSELPVGPVDHGPEKRRQLVQAFDDSRPDGAPLLWLASKTEPTEPERTPLTHVVKMLMTACFILIGGFGARRLGEITSLRSGCLVEEKPGLLEMSVYIEKTLRDVDRIPVPPIIRKVVNILERLTASTRAQTGEDWLFEIVLTKGSKRGGMQLRFPVLLKEFATLNNLTSADDSEKWTFKSHQLRRGFAVFYYHGFRHASLDALSRFLRHFDPEMTRIYINEIVAGAMGRLREEIEAHTKVATSQMSSEDRQWLKEAKKLLDDMAERSDTFNEVRCEALVQRMLGMWDGEEAPIGNGARKLYDDLDAMVAKASAEIRIGSRSNNPDAIRVPLTRLLQEYAKSHYLEPIPGHAAHCTCRPENEQDLATASCLIEKAASRTPWYDSEGGRDIRPDYAFSNCYVCLNCNHCAAFSENRRVIEEKIVRLEDAVVRAATPAAKESAADKFARMKAAVTAARQVTEGRGSR